MLNLIPVPRGVLLTLFIFKVAVAEGSEPAGRGAVEGCVHDLVQLDHAVQQAGARQTRTSPSWLRDRTSRWPSSRQFLCRLPWLPQWKLVLGAPRRLKHRQTNAELKGLFFEPGRVATRG